MTPEAGQSRQHSAGISSASTTSGTHRHELLLPGIGCSVMTAVVDAVPAATTCCIRINGAFSCSACTPEIHVPAPPR
jgi:hypothetical protein